MNERELIFTENNHIRLKSQTATNLIERIKDKQHTLDNIMFENVMELSRYLSGQAKELEFKIPDVAMLRNDTINIKNKIIAIYLEKRKP